MKKRMIMVLLILISVSCCIFATSNQEKLDFVRQNVGVMDDFQKTVTYYETMKSPATGFLVNSTIGLGIGSFIEGDVKGGVIGLTGDLIAGAIAGVGLYFNTNGFGSLNGSYPDRTEDMSYEEYMELQDRYNEQRQKRESTGSVLMISGACVYGASRIFQMIRPFTFCNRFNRDLRDAFHITQVAVVPTITSEDLVGTTVALNMAF